MGALCRLENAGIQVLTSLAEGDNYEKIGRAVKIRNFSNRVEVVIDQWLLEKSPVLPPTWRSLYQVLRELNLKELSQQIEEFLTSEYNSSLMKSVF